MTQILTKRGKDKLSRNGFLFVFQKVSQDEDIKFWRCEAFNKTDIKYKARLHTDLNNVVVKELNIHVCDTNTNVEAQKIVTGIKRIMAIHQHCEGSGS